MLTTNVQLVESLHSHRPSRCRKLHRLAGSVILFDEVQTLPPKLAVATLATLSRLCDPTGPFRTSILFATTTQPAFESLSKRVSQLVDPIKFEGTPPTWQPVEINDSGSEMFNIASGRVRVCWEQDEPVAPDDLATRLSRHLQSLCIAFSGDSSRLVAVGKKPEPLAWPLGQLISKEIGSNLPIVTPETIVGTADLLKTCRSIPRLRSWRPPILAANWC